MSFKPRVEIPTARTLITRSNLGWPRSRHERIIRTHCFNHALAVFLPTARAPNPLPDWLAMGSNQQNTDSTESAFYYEALLPLSYFIQPEFLTQYIRNAASSVIAITSDVHIDSDDVVALDATGRLWLNVTKDTYEQLGLDGKPARYAPKGQRFVIEVDLTVAAMRPGKKMYQRIHWCFLNTLKRKFTFRIAHSHQGRYMEMAFPNDAEAKKIPLCYSAGQCRDLKIPDFTALYQSPEALQAQAETEQIDDIPGNSPTALPLETQRGVWQEVALEYREWLGMVACRADRMLLGDKVDLFVSTYQTPEPNVMEDGYECRWSGLITAEHVHSTLIGLWKSIHNADIPWAALHVWGYEDAPVSWDTNEHSYLQSGESNYTFVLWRDGTYVLYQDVGHADAYN